jgi:hypothetical protein
MAISNTLSAILPKILARGLLSLRTRVNMTKLVNLDYAMEAKKKGTTIDIPIASDITVGDVAPAAYPAAPSNLTPATVQITLNNWKQASFGLTDKELGQIEAQTDFIPLEMSAAFEGLAAAINDSVFAEYKGVYGFEGTGGTTPFGAGVEVTSATELRKLLNKQKAPRMDRRGVLDFDAEASALALSQFSDADKVGSSEVKINGEIGRKFGLDWYADDGVPQHTAGTIGSADLLVNGAHATTGVTTVSMVTAVGGDLNEGDILTIAGDSQSGYAVGANVTLAAGVAGDVTITPGLKVACTGSEAVTLMPTHRVNLGFHRDAFALAMRAPDAALKEVYSPENSYTMADPVSGLVFRLEVIRMYKQVMWELDCLWGVKLVRAALAARLAG